MCYSLQTKKDLQSIKHKHLALFSQVEKLVLWIYQGKKRREQFFLTGHHCISIMWVSASIATSVIIHR